MSGLSKMIADFFVRENVIEHEEYEIYKYGSDILIENIGTTIFLICLGFIFNKEISTLIFIAVFAGIRRYSGGYHAKTKLKCYILTITNWAVVIVLQRLQQKFGFTRFGIELIICCMVFMVMFFFAPVENPGKPLFERVRIVNKRKTLLQEEITMKNKLKKALCLGLVLTMFSTTAVMASTKSYSFGLMPENVDHTEAVQKSGSSAYAAVDVQYMNYPSATIKYQTQVADKGFTSAYTSKIGLGSIRVIYNQRVTSDDKVSLYAYNPSSNGVVTVSVKGNFTP